MTLLTIVRIIKLGWHNYWRNRGLSISATLILTLTLFIILTFILLNTVLGQISEQVRGRIDRLEIFFTDIATDAQIQDLQTILAARTDVQAVHYISKDAAAERFAQFRTVSDRIKQLPTSGKNALPRSLEVQASNPDQLALITASLEEPPWSDLIGYNTYQMSQDTIPKLSRMEKTVTTTGIVLSSIFVLISIIVVISTIRLAIFARREEIEIMRLVGANNLFIRVPFLVEATLYALVASLLAFGLTWLAVDRTGKLISRYLSDITFNLADFFHDYQLGLFLVELVIGWLVAMIASLISIQRYLKR